MTKLRLLGDWSVSRLSEQVKKMVMVSFDCRCGSIWILWLRGGRNFQKTFTEGRLWLSIGDALQPREV